MNNNYALIVVDVQEGFVSDNTRYVLSKINRCIERFSNELIIATKFINKGGGFKDILHWKRLVDEPEISLINEVSQNAQYIIEKNTYSAYTTEVKQLIKEYAVENVFILGIDTDCCVLKTALDLFEDNVRPIVVEDCCASNGGIESHRAAIRVLERTVGKAQIMKLDDISCI